MQTPLYKYMDAVGSFDFTQQNAELLDIIRQNGVRNMVISKKLGEVLQKFEAEDIFCVVLKGCYLINQIYPFGVRPIEDIDLLVQPKDYKAVDKLLRELKYYDCAVSIEPWVHRAFSNKMTYVDDSFPNIPVDIHYSLGPYPYLGQIPTKTILENCELIKNDLVSFFAFKPELLVIHLCIHAFFHINENYKVSCCDIISVIRFNKGKFDWEKFVELVLKNRLMLPVIEMFKKVNEIVANIVPAERIEELSAIKTSPMEKMVYQLGKKNKTEFEKYILQYITTPGFLNKITVIPTFIYPGRKFLNMHFSGSYIKYISKAFGFVIKSLKTLLNHH